MFALKFAVVCGTCILDVQRNKLLKKLSECAGISFGHCRKVFQRGAKVRFYNYVVVN